jgi:hypothetical protein
MNYLIFLSRKLAIGSFLGGTLIFITYCMFQKKPIMELGFLYVLTAFCLNGLFLFMLTISAILSKEDRTEKIYAIILMLLNIPIALLYLYLLPNF